MSGFALTDRDCERDKPLRSEDSPLPAASFESLYLLPESTGDGDLAGAEGFLMLFETLHRKRDQVLIALGP